MFLISVYRFCIICGQVTEVSKSHCNQIWSSLFKTPKFFCRQLDRSLIQDTIIENRYSILRQQRLCLHSRLIQRHDGILFNNFVVRVQSKSLDVCHIMQDLKESCLCHAFNAYFSGSYRLHTGCCYCAVKLSFYNLHDTLQFSRRFPQRISRHIMREDMLSSLRVELGTAYRLRRSVSTIRQQRQDTVAFRNNALIIDIDQDSANVRLPTPECLQLFQLIAQRNQVLGLNMQTYGIAWPIWRIRLPRLKPPFQLKYAVHIFSCNSRATPLLDFCVNIPISRTVNPDFCKSLTSNDAPPITAE